ncbi:MAG: type II toxin-antitoxin system Phd/YefM family antitoxin [Chloroflexi bacterium]|nr:type II toxin-antitoxin system Phd/YefM family antitoxin [Chloroflexota bacterium]MCL5075901.1 type II toxin-antitoxin system Phd/YefM family antitoxin [Chloroflexota bacterium]
MSARRISAREARANFSDLLGLVYYTKEPVIVEKRGRPFVVVISPEQYESLQKEQERAWAVVDRVRERNADKAPEEVLRDATAEVEAVRHEMYEEEKRASKRRR